MKFNITIDRGNTALKGAIWDETGDVIAADTFPSRATAGSAIRRLCTDAALNPGASCRAAYCTVAASHRKSDLSSMEKFCPDVIDLCHTTPIPLEICYRTPATLGADRIAAAVGAVAIAGSEVPILVADLGTAATFDYIAPGAKYMGGNIAPGIGLRLKALHEHTSALPTISALGDVPLWGFDTEHAIRSGALRGVAAELEFYYRHAGAPDARAILTGGNASFLDKAGLINFPCTLDPLLVLRGLNYIIVYNSTHENS